jgi:hypothetical protein
VRNLPLQQLEPRRTPSRQHADHHHSDHRASTGPPQRARSRPGRWGQVCQILAANSNQAMHTRDIARHLGLAAAGRPLSSHTAQLCYWARNGRLIRTAPKHLQDHSPRCLDIANEPLRACRSLLISAH